MSKTPGPVKTVPKMVYDTPSFRVRRYWQRHPHRAFALMLALIKSSDRPIETTWPEMKSRGKTIMTPDKGYKFVISDPKPLFRKPPQPFSAKGGCPMCGGVRYDLGWHNDWNGKGQTDRGWWHVSCGTAFSLMTTPADFENYFYNKQVGKCAISGEDLISGQFEIDHTIPLYRVYRDFKGLPIERLLKFWGPGNLRAISKPAHKNKNTFESRERAGHYG